MFKLISLTFILLMTSSNVYSGVIYDWESTQVNFRSNWISNNTLRFEIDAASRTGGWANAINIDSIAINAPTSWSWLNSSDITLSGPGTFGGSVTGTGLNANGCSRLSSGGNHQCWSGLASLSDDMFFDFTFTGGAIITNLSDTPHLKVRFVDIQGSKVGSLLSTDMLSVNVTDVSEPSSLILLGLSAIGLALSRRKKTLKKASSTSIATYS